MQKALSFLAGAVTGALVGATLMVLLTPTSGEDIRTDLRNRVQRMRDEMKSAAASRRAELEQQLASLRSAQG